VLADPAHPEHDGLAEWIGRPLDPEAFDRAAVEAAAQGLEPESRLTRGQGGHSVHDRHEEANMGMLKKLMASGIAAKLIQEARKPENQAKIKQAIADFQAKRANQAKRPGTH
jgi:ABC-type Zn2+ transport system substrate-binding protein/surface adhesin